MNSQHWQRVNFAVSYCYRQYFALCGVGTSRGNSRYWQRVSLVVCSGFMWYSVRVSLIRRVVCIVPLCRWSLLAKSKLCCVICFCGFKLIVTKAIFNFFRGNGEAVKSQSGCRLVRCTLTLKGMTGKEKVQVGTVTLSFRLRKEQIYRG